ncbi:pyridoxamine 5'-phosphate oxidase family protein [Sulfurimonas sp. MAG313]|nr:pyridoxamine 5'-phosphate oxidase family protein [Sulfurimonas sp. MAG313]MDF1881713.1 pyridoxamine 5'-phosphate oxidase family protein [Sulfurimonas sp. MAG313]
MENKTPHEMKAYLHSHHVLVLATAYKDRLSSCSVFYAYSTEDNCLVFASQNTSEHIQNILNNSRVAACIHNEERELDKIKGLQIKGRVQPAERQHEEVYLHDFPEAKDFEKDIWVLYIEELKYTDNELLGLGKKKIFKG